jgi:hypothetical protein
MNTMQNSNSGFTNDVNVYSLKIKVDPYNFL